MPITHPRSFAAGAARLPAMALATCVMVLMIIGQISAAQAQNGPQSVADLAERLSPSVVNITTIQRAPGTASRGDSLPSLPENLPFREYFEEYFRNQTPEGRNQQPNPGTPETPRRGPRRGGGAGSGFVIDSSGIIITNNHVIDGADEIEVRFTDGSKMQAELLGRDPETDIAVLRVQPEKPLKAVPFGDSDKMRVGDWVMAIGNPFGLGGSVTLGIVSARNRDISSGPYDDYIQTDAAINRGNSGGPLFNMDGEVIGINTAIISPSGGSIGIGFSVPSAIAGGVIAQLQEFGETRRGWLGVRIQTVTDDIAESLALGNQRGALVASVTESSPAGDAGIEAGDVITAVNGHVVETSKDLTRAVAVLRPGSVASIEAIRKGNKVEFDVTLGRREKELKQANLQQPGVRESAQPKKALGMGLARLDDELRTKYKVPESVKSGVVITKVDPESAAADKLLEVGDVIAEAGEEAVSQPRDLVDRIEALKKEGRSSILMLVLKRARNGDPHFIALRLKK